MNTFLPHPNFAISAAVIDWRRLNKQVTEGIQLLNLILRLQDKPLPPGYESGAKMGWSNHPVLKLWQDGEGNFFFRELVSYVDAMACRWDRNEHRRKRHRWFDLVSFYFDQDRSVPLSLRWNPSVHQAMVGNLLRKDREHYEAALSRFGIKLEEEREGYIWENPLDIIVPCDRIGVKGQ